MYSFSLRRANLALAHMASLKTSRISALALALESQPLGWKPVNLKTMTSLKPLLKASLRRGKGPLGDILFHQFAWMESSSPTARVSNQQSLFGVYLFLNKIFLNKKVDK